MKRSARRAVGSGCFLGLGLLLDPASAATIDVPGDFATLLAAADEAAYGDTILVAPGTYTDRDTRVIGTETVRAAAFLEPGVTVLATGGPDATFLSADGDDEAAINLLIAATVTSYSWVSIEGFTFQGNDGSTTGFSTELTERARTRVSDCVFEGFRTAIRKDDEGELYVDDSFFRNNDTQGAPSSGVIHATDGYLWLDGCRFVENVGVVVRHDGCCAYVDDGVFLRNQGASVISALAGTIRTCLFYDNQPPADEPLIYAASLSSYATIYAENGGVPLFDGARSGNCNLYWNNEGDSGVDPGPWDLFFDPQFCDPLADNFELAASSPCRSENNYADCGQIGPFGRGCSTTGNVPHVVRADPEGIAVEVDGEPYASPQLFVWPVGTSHTLSCPEQETISGVRWVFSQWSHSADRTNEVTADAAVRFYTASYRPEVYVELIAQGRGTVSPSSGYYPQGEVLQIEGVPDPGYGFTEWIGSGRNHYDGPLNPVSIIPLANMTETAVFEVGEFELSTEVVGEGRIVPEAGLKPAFQDQRLRARAEKGWRFVEWRGEGDGSYTGRQNPVTITMDDNVTQLAVFEPVRFDVGLSLSRFSSNVHEGSPVGFGEVHLWLTCAEGRRLQEVEIQVAGTMDVLTFVPAPGMVSQGTNPVTVNTGVCRWSSARLGHFLVNDPGGGTLCIDIAGNAQPLVVTDCSGSPSPWPGRVSFVGVNTAGGTPCSTGTGCNNQIETGPEAVGGTGIALAAPMRIGLNEVFPNPFTGETTIRYGVSRPQPVRIAVYDVTGRRVRVLRNAPVDPGVSSMVWDGRDFAGARVASGVYFVRLQADEITEARKVIRLAPR